MNKYQVRRFIMVTSFAIKLWIVIFLWQQAWLPMALKLFLLLLMAVQLVLIVQRPKVKKTE